MFLLRTDCSVDHLVEKVAFDRRLFFQRRIRVTLVSACLLGSAILVPFCVLVVCFLGVLIMVVVEDHPISLESHMLGLRQCKHACASRWLPERAVAPSI